MTKKDKRLWDQMSLREQRSYIAYLRATGDDIEAGIGETWASWSARPKSEQHAFAQALRREADKLERETPSRRQANTS